MKCISSSVFGRFIGIPTVIKISDSGIAIEVEHDFINIQWQELIVPPEFHLSFFGQILTFKTADKNYVFTMLAYNSKLRHKSNIQQLWASSNIKRVDTLLTAIKKIISNRYLRQSTIERIQLSAKQEGKRWFPWVNLSKLGKLSKSSKALAEVAEKLQLLFFYQRWTDQGIADCRESYINKQLQVHRSYFDTVESNPLTPRQRKA